MKLNLQPIWLALPGLILAPASQGQGKDPAAEGRKLRQGDEAARQAFFAACQEAGIEVDFSGKKLSVAATAHDADMPIEYLVVGPRGATHETLFVTSAKPSLLVMALYALGLEPGRNVEYRDRNPAPSEKELTEGILPYEVLTPEGPGAYLYASWNIDGESRRFRLEDLVLNTKTGKTARPVRWVFLGSRFLRPSKDAAPLFAADLEENLVSICFFAAGNQIFTNPDRDGQEQHLFVPNSWLLPPKGTPVRLTFSLDRIEMPAEARVR